MRKWKKNWIDNIDDLEDDHTENDDVKSLSEIKDDLDSLRWEQNYKTENLLYIDMAIKLLELDNDGYVKVGQLKIWVPSNYLLTALKEWKEEYEKI